MNILFVGNSFTYYNEMPNMVENIGITNGKIINVEHITYGGYSLIQYLDSRTNESKEVMNKLNEKNWDYVVIQDQSSKPDINKKEFLSSIESFNSLITENGAQTVLYSTWSYKDGSKKLANTGYTYTEFYTSLTKAYKEAKHKYDTLLAPVGTVFYNLTRDHPSIDLIVEDDFHPNIAGSYVAAYTFYTLLVEEENNNEYLPSGLSSELASTLRTYVLKTLSIK